MIPPHIPAKRTLPNDDPISKSLSIEDQNKVRSFTASHFAGKELPKRLEGIAEAFKSKGSKVEKDVIPEIINLVSVFSSIDAH